MGKRIIIKELIVIMILIISLAFLALAILALMVEYFQLNFEKRSLYEKCLSITCVIEMIHRPFQFLVIVKFSLDVRIME